MRKKVINATLTEESHQFIKNVMEETNSSRSAAVDLIIDAVSGNLGMHMIVHHYHNGYDRKDGRKKER